MSETDHVSSKKPRQVAIGDKFGYWTVMAKADKPRYFVCKCECGSEKLVRNNHLLSGASASCRCRGSKPELRPGVKVCDWTLIRRVLNRRWLCKCTCGVEKEVLSSSLVDGSSKSCGCDKDTFRSDERKIWWGMIDRCTNTKCTHYARYGGRGIKVCQRWMESYWNFLEDVGRRPGDNYSLDRIDNNGNYEPGNIRWSTDTEQCRNKSNNRIITYNNVTKTLIEWSESTGLKPTTIDERIKRGWSIEEALTIPIWGNRTT